MQPHDEQSTEEVDGRGLCQKLRTVLEAHPLNSTRVLKIVTTLEQLYTVSLENSTGHDEAKSALISAFKSIEEKRAELIRLGGAAKDITQLSKALLNVNDTLLRRDDADDYEHFVDLYHFLEIVRHDSRLQTDPIIFPKFASSVRDAVQLGIRLKEDRHFMQSMNDVDHPYKLSAFYSRLEKLCRACGEFHLTSAGDTSKKLALADDLRKQLLHRNHAPTLLVAIKDCLAGSSPDFTILREHCARLVSACRLSPDASRGVRRHTREMLLDALQVVTSNRHLFKRSSGSDKVLEMVIQELNGALHERQESRPKPSFKRGVVKSVDSQPGSGRFGYIHPTDEENPQAIFFNRNSLQNSGAYPQVGDHVLFLVQSAPGIGLIAADVRHEILQLEKQVTGVVKMLQSDRAFGIITTQDGRDAFFHFNSLKDIGNPPAINTRVRCELWQNERGLNAWKIELLEQLAGRLSAFGNRGYGFIAAENDMTYFFRLENVVDDDLRKRLESPDTDYHVEVTFKPVATPGHKYDLATQVTPNWSPEERVARAIAFEKTKRYDEAVRIARTIRQNDPENSAAREIEERERKRSGRMAAAPKGGDPFSRAKRAWVLDEDLDAAEALYKEAIERNINRDNAIKDLASLLSQRGRSSEAIALLEGAISRPGRRAAFAGALTTAYEHAGRYQEAIKMLQQEIDHIERNQHDRKLPPSQLATDKHAVILRRLGFAYFKEGKYADAETVLLKAVKLRPNYLPASKLLDKLQVSNRSGRDSEVAVGPLGIEEIEDNFDVLIEDSFAPLSPLAEAAIKKSKFEGIEVSKVKSGNLTFADAKSVAEAGAEVGTRRPREYAQYFLTAAAIIYKLRHHNTGTSEETAFEHERALAEYLGRYFLAMAQIAKPDVHLDVLRTYYIEAFALWSAAPWFPLFSYLKIGIPHERPAEEREESLKEPIRRLLLQAAQKQDVFDRLFSRFLFLSVNSRRALGMVWGIIPAEIKLLQAVSEYLKLGTHNSRDAISKALHQRRLQLAEDIQILRTVCLALGTIQLNTSRMEDLLQQLERIRPRLINDLDRERLTSLQRIGSEALSFCKADDWEGHEIAYQSVLILADEFIKKVTEEPTLISFQCFLPLAEHLRSLVEEGYADVARRSTPDLTINLTVESYASSSEGTVSLSINVSNRAKAAPANNVELCIHPYETEFYYGGENFYRICDSLRGGERKEGKLPMTIRASAFSEGAFAVGLLARYSDHLGRAIQATEPVRFTVRLVQDSEWNNINNPYAAYSGGNPVLQSDTDMFVGRDELIGEIKAELLAARTTKSIFLHGQKRTGKTSILAHLKHRLNTEPKCVAFYTSIHEARADESFSASTVLFQLLTALRRVLRLKRPGQHPPNLKIPPLTEFKSNPSIYFHECLSEFRSDCADIPASQDLRIVALIDEFTDIFWLVQRGQIRQDFMKFWKSIVEKGYFSCVLVGKDIAPRFRQQFANEFAVTEDRRVTYLAEPHARDLIEKIGRERYKGNAIRRILDLTAGSPFFTMLFCDRLVDYMNDPASPTSVITEVDVDAVARRLTEGMDALIKATFAPFYDPGDGKIETDITEDEYFAVLSGLAKNSTDEWCENGNLPQVVDNQAAVLDDLVQRQVIVTRKGAYKIVVGLFREWLQKRP